MVVMQKTNDLLYDLWGRKFELIPHLITLAGNAQDAESTDQSLSTLHMAEDPLISTERAVGIYQQLSYIKVTKAVHKFDNTKLIPRKILTKSFRARGFALDAK